MLKILLALRNHAHQVEVLVPNGETRSVLGTSHPEEENRRVNVVKQWGCTTESPRQQRQSTIDLPLPQRSQTILSYRVNPVLQNVLNGGSGSLADSRMHNRTTVVEALDAAQTPKDGR